MDGSEDRTVAEWYNATSESYDQLYAKEQYLKQKAISAFLGDNRFTVLVDIGCGTGTFLHEEGRFYKHGVGIDLARNMLKIAQKKRSSGTDLILASFHSLPIRDNSAECIVSISSVKSNSNFDQFVAEIKRIAHRPATIALTILNERPTVEQTDILNADHSLQISNRETMFCFRLNG